MIDRLARFTGPTGLRRSVIILTIALVVALALLQAVNLWSRYNETVSDTQTKASDLSYILAEHMQSSVAAVDASLKQLVLHSSRVGGPGAPADLWSPVLRNAIAGMSYVGSLTITDADGVIRHSTLPALIGQSRREDFMFNRLSSDPHAGIIADTPFRRLSDQRLIMPLGRRLDGADGSFQGIVVATLVPEAFRDFYKSVDVGNQGVIRVLHSTGVVFFSEARSDLGKSGNPSTLLRQYLQTNKTGVLSETLDSSSERYITAWHSLNEPPITVAVSLDQREGLHIWRRDAWLSLGLTALIALVLAAGSLQLIRQLNLRAATELSLVQREQELVAAQRVAGLGAVRFSAPDLVANVSPQFCGLLGLPPESNEVALDLILDPLSKSDRSRLRRVLDECLATGKTWQLELHAKLADGSERILWSEGVAQTGDDGSNGNILAIFQDVTERRLAEQLSSQSERLAAIGRMTGGVAHDFNNMLTVISGRSQLLLGKLGQDSYARSSIEEVAKAADRAAGLTRQLLAFSRKQILQPKVLELNTIVADVEKMLRRLIGEDISLALNLHPALGHVKADPGQIEQVLVNLAVNSRDAMPDGGKLIIETSNVDLDDSYARNHVTVQPGAYVLLAVSDTGIGMDKETQSHIFEPFFSTKAAGKGTGLGLSTVYGIVKQSGGNIWVYSEPGKGTTFKIYLPRVVEPSDTTPTRDPVAAVSRGSETILLVEDEDSLRKLGRDILELNGYTVLAAANGIEALALHHQNEDRIQLIVTDVVMPGMGGRELAERIAAVDPMLRVLYMSGYTDDAVVLHGLGKGINFIQKPFSPDLLAQKVREVLDQG